MPYKVNKKKCTSCGVCITSCPGATRIGEDAKAEVIDQEKLKKCGGESICPFGAIEKE
jgi:ferredoxin